ncbi:MAG: prolipoprotein diacylglyceryl transferase [Clostridia bacterium]|nr:prolipoprotein diacylglyceryl transferase [Clostridia bacterium]
MYQVTIFGIHLTLKPVAFSIPLGSNKWHIYWYGILIAFGFLLALLYGFKNAKRFDIDPDRMVDVILVTTPLAVLCARSYYLIFDGEPIHSISDFFGFGNSSGFAGLAIYGGVIGALVVGGIMCRLRKVPIWNMFDLTAIGFCLGQSVGRWGNFVNQEAYGAFTGSSFFGMESTRTIAEMGPGMVHPCFLYESIWCLGGFFLLHFLSKRRQFNGQIILTYGIWYGTGRALIELLRTDSLMIGNLKVSCLLSVLAVLGCATALVLILRRKKTAVTEETYQSVFDNEETPVLEEEKNDVQEN